MRFFSIERKNIIKKVSLSFGFLFLVGAFVYAAGGPFTPGETLDPTCDPYISPGVPDTNCVVTAGSGGGMVIGDPVTNSDKGAIFFSDGNNNLGQDISNFFWDEKNKLLGVGTSSPGARIHSDGSFATGSDISSPTKTVDISAYNKLSLDGSYSGSTSSTWIIQIVDDSVDPQLFRYSTDSGSTWSGDLPITVGYSSLQDGVEAGFSTTTGYANGDEWQFDVTAGGGSDIDALLLSVNGFEEMRVGKDGIRFFDAYNFPDQDGNNGDVLTADGNGQLTWQAPSGGGGGSSSLAANAIGFGNGSDLLSGDKNNLFWDFDFNRMAIGSGSASTSLDIFSSSYNQTVDTSSWQASTQCTNCVTSLDDLSVNTSSSYTESFDADYEIVIDSTGSPDTFSWYKQGVLKGANVPILGGSQNQLLGDGVEINFSSNTGHTLGSHWLIHEYIANPNKPSYSCTNCTNTLNDIAVDVSAFTGSSVLYTVTIDSDTPYETFSWSKGGIVQGSGVMVVGSGAQQQLDDNLYISFGANTGHTVGTTWDIDVTYQTSSSTNTLYNDPFQVRDQNSTVAFKVNKSGNLLIKGVEYVFPSSQGGAGQVLKNDGNGNLTWEDDDTGGGGGSSLIGSTATSGTETWLGETAGGGSASYNSTVFIGENAGLAAVSAPFSTFVGVDAGSNASNATYSNFFGIGAGTGATLASNSVFIGTNAGASAASAARSIFIGNGAGSMDTVNNTFSVNDHSILIGDNSSTDGNSNSIALGTGATNTASNQFLIDDSYTQFNMRGVNWVMPSSQGGAGQVLTNDGSGVLTWETPSGGSTNIYNSNGTLSGTRTINADNNSFTINNLSSLLFDVNDGSEYAQLSMSPSLATLGFSGTYLELNPSLNSIFSYGNIITLDAAQSIRLKTPNVSSNSAANGQYLKLVDAATGEVEFSNGLFGSTSVVGNEVWVGDSSTGSGASSNFTNFFGKAAGAGATNADNSIFLGFQTGYSATNASNSIFIGNQAGWFDSVDNTSGGNSIVIGNGSSTGGYSNSIALGSSATNTAAYQFALSDSITSWKFQGDSYTLPTSYGSNGQVLTTDSSGVLTWATPSDTDTNIYNTDGTLTSNRTIDADGNWLAMSDLYSYSLTTLNDASNFNLGQTGFSFSLDSSNTYLSGNQTDLSLSADNLFLEAYDLLKIITPSINSAAVGDVLTLQNVSTGEVEYKPVSDYAWGKTGNAGTTAGTNFIGTTDAKDLVFKTNNSEMARLKSNGNIELGSGASATGTLFGSSFAVMGGTASGGASFAFGASAVSSGPYSVATPGSVSSGQFSFATGRGTASGESSNSFGYGTLSKGFSETALGMSNTDYTPVGGQAPADRLFVVGNGDYGPSNRSDAFTILHNGQTGVGIDNFEANSNGNIFQVGNGSTGVIGYVNSGTGAWVTVSDARDKDNIEDLNYNIDTLMGLRPVSFDYKNNGEHTIGFVAQEAKDIVPESVFGSEDEKYGMSYSNLVPVTVKAIQDIFNLVDSFREKLVNWFADAANGIGDLFVKRVRTETLCVGTPGNETCITKEQLDTILGGQSSGASGNGGGISSNGSGNSTNEGDIIVPDSDPIPDPAPIDNPVSDPDPEPVVDEAPDPEPAPDPAPEPSPES